MKTFTTTHPVILLLLVLLFNSCSLCKLCKIKVRHYETETENTWRDPEESNIDQRSLIASFLHPDSVNEKFRNFITTTSLEIKDSCACGTLFLLGDSIGNTIIPEGLLASRPREPKQNGATFFNLKLNLNIIRDRTKLINYGLVREKNGVVRETSNPSNRVLRNIHAIDTTIVALIDGGIPRTDMFEDILWVNREEHNKQPDFDDDENCYKDDIHGYDFTNSLEANMHGNYITQIISNTLGEDVNYRIMDVKIFDKQGVGNLFDALCAIDYAIKNGADIINLSWGYYRKPEQEEGIKSDSLLLHFLQKADSVGIPVFASAGNDSTNTDIDEYHLPSGFFENDRFARVPQNLISVAALNQEEDSLALYSNYGEQSVSISSIGVHKVKGLGFWIGNGIAGTSFSTPYALCHAIKIMQKSPGIKPADLKRCLIDRSTYLGIPIESEGKINVHDTRRCN